MCFGQPWAKNSLQHTLEKLRKEAALVLLSCSGQNVGCPADLQCRILVYMYIHIHVHKKLRFRETQTYTQVQV